MLETLCHTIRLLASCNIFFARKVTQHPDMFTHVDGHC